MPVPFKFLPNWSSPVSETISFSTEIIVSRNRVEQRRALRYRHRREFSFNVAYGKDGALSFGNFMKTMIQAEVSFPDFTSSQTVLSGAVLGSTQVIVDAVPDWLDTGGSILLIGRSGAEEIGVLSFSGTTINLVSAVSKNIGAGVKIYRPLLGRLEQQNRQNLITTRAVSSSVSFKEDPGSEEAEISAASRFFDGKEVFVFRPNWADGLELSSEGFLETVDTGVGVVSHHSMMPWNRFLIEMNFLGRTREEVRSFCDFFKRQKGRRGSFFIPTWGGEFNGLVDSLGQVRAPGIEFASMFSGHDVFNRVFVLYKNGAIQENVISEIAESAGESVLTFRDAWSQALSQENVAHFCWLLRARMSFDAVEIEWLTGRVAQWKMSFSALPKEAP